MSAAMSFEDENLLPTRRSLLQRLRNCEDQESWRDFFKTYWKLMYSFAVRCGCTDTEAEEVVQDAMICVAEKMPEYRYDPALCTFKGWLLHLTKCRVVDKVRRRRFREVTRFPSGIEGADVVDQLAGTSDREWEAIWDQEWQKNLIDAAMERVKGRVNAEHYQIFHLLLVKQQPPRKVASMLNINIARVYLAKHRVSALVRKEVELLTKKPF
jgi:RNA polymerase sigma factor (sigma-70 family)